MPHTKRRNLLLFEYGVLNSIKSFVILLSYTILLFALQQYHLQSAPLPIDDLAGPSVYASQ